MRSSLLTSLGLACGALLFSMGAEAIPVHVGLVGAAGQQSWTSPGFGDPSYVTLTAWELENDAWQPAFMTLDSDGLGNPGLGVCGSQPNNDFVCADANETNQIDALPPQIIDMDISHFDGWSSLTITLLSFDQQNWNGLFGNTCTPGSSNCSTPVSLIDTCTGPDTNGIVSCAITKADVSEFGYTNIWISPSYGCPDSTPAGPVNCDFLLGAGEDQGLVVDVTPEAVPEPAAWGMFGLGVLLIGVFLGLRRRQTH